MNKPHNKLVQIKTNVGADVDIQKLIGQLHQYVSKSKMKDRIEIHVNGVVSEPPPVEDGSYLL